MRFEKIDENRIRIFLNLEDLEEKNIDLHTFMSNSLETQDLFLDMLSEAEAKLGFKTQNYKLMIEALASSDGSFILTVTREKADLIPNKAKTKQPKAKRKTATPSKLLSIYSFNSFDEFCEFCDYISSGILNNCITKFKNSSLYLLNGKYYLILNNIKISVAELKIFSSTISEFAGFVRNENLFERKLKEYGKPIIAKNAIATCLKYFSNL